MVPMRQILPCSGPNEVPISMPKSLSIMLRTASPLTPSGMTTPVTFGILWLLVAEQLRAPSRSSPAASASLASRWRAKQCVEPFGEHDAHRLARGIQHRGRLGVMVEPALAPVIHQHAEIEIVRLDDRPVAVDEIRGLDAGLDMLARRFTTSTTRSLNVIGDEPGGPDRHFCKPAETASTCQASIATFMPPSEAVASV